MFLLTFGCSFCMRDQVRERNKCKVDRRVLKESFVTVTYTTCWTELNLCQQIGNGISVEFWCHLVTCIDAHLSTRIYLCSSFEYCSSTCIILKESSSGDSKKDNGDVMQMLRLLVYKYFCKSENLRGKICGDRTYMHCICMWWLVFICLGKQFKGWAIKVLFFL